MNNKIIYLCNLILQIMGLKSQSKSIKRCHWKVLNLFPSSLSSKGRKILLTHCPLSVDWNRSAENDGAGENPGNRPEPGKVHRTSDRRRPRVWRRRWTWKLRAENIREESRRILSKSVCRNLQLQKVHLVEAYVNAKKLLTRSI